MSIADFIKAPVFLGFDAEDEAKPFARFMQPEDPEYAKNITAAHMAPKAARSFEPFSDIAAALSKPGYLPYETGWGVLPNGAAVVAMHTQMPGVRAEMWDWWFAWHGSDPARYKLWAPAAHYVALWKDGDGERAGRKSYIGRTSLIKEQIGSVYLEGAIRFVEPASIGFANGAFDGTVICGRAGEVEVPVEHTWLIHQLRNTEEGCEMRSRFYLGQDPQFTYNGEPLPPPAPSQPESGPKPVELMLHCATEMDHLAGFLPELYAAFN